MSLTILHDRPLSLAEWDPPCKNCGRFGTFPGQLITDNFNNTFCSADCGWSHLLRPHEQQRIFHEKARIAAANTAAIQIPSGPHPRRPARRPSRTSRKPAPQQQQQASQLPQHRALESSRLAPVQNAPVIVSARRPPRSPTLGSGKHADCSEAVERATRLCVYSGNAMFDYCIATGGLADL